MTNMPEFHPGLSASHAHRLLKSSVEIMDQAHHCTVLWFGEIMQRKLYRVLGYSTMRAYALEELGYTVAREIASVAVPETEKEWLTEAQTKSRRDLSATVKHAREVAKREAKTDPNQGELLPRPASPAPAAVIPVRVTFELSPLEYARYEALVAKAKQTGSKAELLLEMATALAAEITPRGVKSPADPHYQIHVHQCPDCAKNTVQTPQGEKVLSEAEAEAIHEDAQVHNQGQANTSTIPPKTRREVLARDRHQCRRKGCSHTRHLHIHHLVLRAQGGTNDEDNLITLCSACHQLWHKKGRQAARLTDLLSPEIEV